MFTARTGLGLLTGSALTASAFCCDPTYRAKLKVKWAEMTRNFPYFNVTSASAGTRDYAYLLIGDVGGTNMRLELKVRQILLTL